MSEAFKIGELKKFTRKTFLHEGIFVHSNSMVKVLELRADDIVIEFTDMEGYTHNLEGVQAHELE